MPDARPDSRDVRTFRRLVLAIFVLMTLPCAMEAQVITENAGVQSPELPLLYEQLRILETENLTELRLASQFVFSFTPSFETRLIVPTVFRDIDLPTPTGELDENLFGLGDASVRLKYSLWQEDEVMESSRWAALTEGVFPTGEHQEEIDDIELPRKLQLGTGGFGVGLGTAFTVIRDRHRFSAELFYRHRTRHDGFHVGDSVSIYWFRLTPAEFRQAEAETEVRAVFELLSTLQADNIGGSRAFGDGGGAEVWLAPGIQIYASPRVLFEASFQIPIVDAIDDALGNRHWGATVGVKFVF